MLEEKEALEEVSEEEVKEIEKKLKEKGIKFECIPSKVVYSKKPIPGGSKHKVRWVICGNYEEKRDDEQTYSAGADATAFRLMLWFAARNQWLGMSLDIRTAFLNAVIDQEDQSNYILVAPPTIFVKKGCLRPGTLYRPKRAVYGLRRSPRLWGLCRDSEMRSFEVEVEKKEGGKIKLQLRQLDSEPNLWRLEEVGKEEGSEPSIQYGLVMTYVDDIFITGPPKSPERWHRSSKRLGPRQNQKSWGRKPFASLAWKCQPQRMPKVEMFGMSPKNPLSRTW